MEENFLLDLVSALDQSKSKKQVNSDIKQLEKVINMLQLTGTFAQGSTKKELNACIKSLQSQLNHVKLTAKIDSKNLKSEINSALNKVSFKDIDILNIDENKTKLKIQKVIVDAKAYAEKNPVSIGVNIESKKSKLRNDLTSYLNRNTKISESSVLLQEADKVRNLINAINDKKSLREATDAFQLYKSEVSATGFATKSTTDKIKNMFGHITKLGSVFSITSMAFSNFTRSLGTLNDIDDILTEISKTSNMTVQELEKLGNISFKSASKYGKTATDYLTGIQEMSRSGFYGEKGSAMAEQSLLAQAAGNMSADVANKYILATNAAYKFNGEAEKLNAVLDGQNSITNRNSVAMSDMAVAMSEAGTVASSYRVSIEDLSAMIGTMESVTKLGGSEVGNGIKAILINLQNINSSKIVDTLDAANASMTEFVNGTEKLRDPISILRDLAKTFNQLDEDDALRAEILTNIGGKHQASKLAALLQNMEMFDKMLVDYSEGAGSAMEEAMKSANNWSGKLNQIQNSWDSLVNSLTSKKAVLGGLTFFDKLIQGAESFIDTFGTIPTILTAINSSMVAMKKDYGITQLINPETKKLDIQGNVLGIDFSAIKEQKKHFEEAKEVIAIWNNKLKSGKANLDSFNNEVVQNNAQLKNYLSTCSKDAPASLSGYKAHLNAAGVSTDALRLKTILLNSAISMGIGVAIQAAVQGITYLIQREENLRQATEEAANAYKESSKSIDDYVSKYQELREALIKAKGNEEETYAIKKQLLELQTDLNDKFGDAYGAINLVTEAYRDQTEAIKALNKETAQTFLNENKEGIDKSAKEMTKDRHYNLSYTGLIGNTDKGEALKEIAEKYKEQGITLLDEYGDGTYLQFSIHLNTDAQSAYETINAFENDLREKAKELGSEHMFDDVLDVSSDSLNKAKETIEKYGDTYRQALTAEIVSDDDRAETYSEALKAVEAYNDAVLRAENPYDDQNVTQAKENLDAIKNSIQDNEAEWGKYSILFDDIFGQADTRLLEFNEALKADSGLKELAENLKGLSDIDLQALDESIGANDSFDKLKEAAAGYKVNVDELIGALVRLGYVQGEIQGATSNNENLILTFNQAWADSFTSENDAVKELGNTLLGLAEKGRLTKEIFNEADSTTGGYFKNLGISADEAVSKINKLVDESKQLSSMSDQISSISEALGTKRDNNFVDADTLSGFDVEVRGLDSWDRFQEVLGSTTSSYNECQEAANALATEWVNSSDFLAQLTEQNEEYYATQLQAMGVENYEEVIAYAQELNSVKEALAQASFNVATATNAEVQSLIDTGTYSEIAQQQIWNLVLAKQAEEGITLDTSADCQNLLTLAQNAGVTGEAITLLTQLLEIYNNLAAGTYGTNAQVINAVKNKAESLKTQINDIFANGVKGNTTEIDNRIKVSPSTKSSAKSAGKDTGKSYKEGLEEELSDLNSVISGITGRIDDQIGVIRSQKEAAVAAIDAQIDALNEQKSALEDQKKALEEERDARLEIIEVQKEQLELAIKSIDKQIKQKEKVIKGIQAEIAAMQNANEERKLQINLQKEQYELERLQHQRTILIYSEEKGLHYTANTKDIRDQKQKVDDARLEIEIANKQKQIDLIEKEIDLLNEKKDAINEQIDILNEQIDKINEFYDAQIKVIDAQIESIDKQIEELQKQREQTEKYFESLVDNLEKSKSKYEELTEIVEKAELSAALKQLGIDEEALLNGSEEEFNKLKNAYMDVVTQLNSGNDEVLSSLQELSGYDGTAPAMLSDSNTELDEMNGKLDTSNQSVQSVNSSLGETATTTGDVTTNVGELESSLSEVNSLVTEEQTAFNNLKQTITEVIEAIDQKTQAIQEEQNAVGTATGAEMANFELLKNKILEIKETLDSINNTVTTLDTTPVNNLTTAFQLLYNQLLLVASTLGTGLEGQEEGAVSGITSAIQALNEISLEEGIIAQFDNLKTAVDSVTSAISGGGESSEGEGSGDSSGSKSNGGESGGSGSEGEGGGGNSLTGAITEMGDTAKEVIGEPDAEGDGTVIGEFGALKTAVDDVTTAIGGGESEGGEGQEQSSGGEEEGNLIGSIVNLGEQTEETLGAPDGDGVIGRFGQFKDVIAEADEHVHGISDGLDEIDGREVECTIKINIETSGNVPAYASGTALGAMNLNSSEYTAKYSGNAHVAGTANVTGNWGVRKPGKSLVGELGQEIWVHSADGTFETVGDNGPEWIKTEKGDLIFNHLQTKELLDKGNIVKTGRAYANGSVQYSDGTIITQDGVTLRPIEPGDRAYELQKAFEPLLKKIDNNLDYLTGNVMAEHSRQMEQMINHLNTTNVVNNTKNVQPVVHQNITVTCPNVTNNSGIEYIQKELGHLSLLATQEPLRRY